MTTYTVAKDRGLWWVIDEEGYEISSVGHDTKKEALDAAKVATLEERERDALPKVRAVLSCSSGVLDGLPGTTIEDLQRNLADALQRGTWRLAIGDTITISEDLA